MNPFRKICCVALLLTIVFLVAGCEGRPPSDSAHRSRSDKKQRAEVTRPTNSPNNALVSPTPRIIKRRTADTTSAAFVVRDREVFFPGYDDRGATAPPELLRLDARIFSPSTNVYQEKAIFTKPVNESTTFTLPREAQEIGFLVRGVAVEDEWPRLRISLVSQNPTSEKLPLFEGNVAWKELRYIWSPIPEEFRGKVVRLKAEMLNPEYSYWQRAVHLATVVVRGQIQD